MSPSAKERRARVGRGRTVVVIVATVVALTGCSGEGGGSLPTTLPTTLPSVSLPSVTLPSITLPTVTLPTVTLPTVTGPTVTVTEDRPEATTEAPEPPVTEEETPEAEETAAPQPEETTADDDASSWPGLPLFLLLLGLVAAVVGAVVLLRRRRERADWSARVEESLPEAEWLRDSIVPDLIGESPDGRAGIWVVTRPRVVGLEENVRRLVTEAPDPALARPVQALTTAVEALRRLLDQADRLAGFGGPSVTAALQRSRAELDDAITAIRPPAPQDGAQV